MGAEEQCYQAAYRQQETIFRARASLASQSSGTSLSLTSRHRHDATALDSRQVLKTRASVPKCPAVQALLAIPRGWTNVKDVTSAMLEHGEPVAPLGGCSVQVRRRCCLCLQHVGESADDRSTSLPCQTGKVLSCRPSHGVDEDPLGVRPCVGDSSEKGQVGDHRQRWQLDVGYVDRQQHVHHTSELEHGEAVTGQGRHPPSNVPLPTPQFRPGRPPADRTMQHVAIRVTLQPKR
jgi:hypothetical protein